MISKEINCPCCNNKITIKFKDTGEICSVFFNGENQKINQEKLEDYNIYFGTKGGDG